MRREPGLEDVVAHIALVSVSAHGNGYALAFDGLKVIGVLGLEIDQPALDFAVFLGLVNEELNLVITTILAILALFLRSHKDVIHTTGHDKHRDH